MPRNADQPEVPAERKPPREGRGAGRKCGGSTKKGTDTCKHPAGYKTPHLGWGRCYLHGGCTKTGVAYAAKQRAAGLVKFYGAPIDTDPIEALLDEVRRTAGHVAYLGQKVSSWNQEMDDDGSMPNGLKDWIALYQSERRHLVQVSKATLDAGVNERLVQIAEHQGTRLADAVESILKALNLTPEQQLLVPEIVPAALRSLAIRPLVIEGETG